MAITVSRKILCISISSCLFAMVIGMTQDEAYASDNAVAVDMPREKRSLVFPHAPLLQLNFAITVPFNIPSRPLQLSWGYQLNFILPKNATDLYPKPHRARREAGSMATPFLELEGLLRTHGFKGRDCLLRSICELAESPLDWDDHGVVEELLHAILTPSVSVTSYERFSHQPYNEDVFEEARFLEAEQRGLSGDDCVISYTDCTQSPLELFTQRISAL